MSEARAPLSAEALADPQPNVPHEKVRAEMLRDLAELRRRDDLPRSPRPVLDCRHG